MALTCRIANNLVVLFDCPLYGIGIDPFLERGKIVFWSSLLLVMFEWIVIGSVNESYYFSFQKQSISENHLFR